MHVIPAFLILDSSLPVSNASVGTFPEYCYPLEMEETSWEGSTTPRALELGKQFSLVFFHYYLERLLLFE